jgi:hypothetical protein
MYIRMGQVQSQPQVQQPWSIWSLFGAPSYQPVNPGQYAPMVYMSQPTMPAQSVVVQKVPNVKVNVKPNTVTNKNKNKAVVQAPVANTSAPVNFSVANAQPAVQNTSQSNPTSGGRKQTRRMRK